ncbi:MAG: response regulator [Thermoleophilia bacterium]
MENAHGNGHRQPLVLIAAEDQGVRSGFERSLKEHPRAPRVESSPDSESTLTKASELRPDVILVHASLAPENGFDTARRLVAQVPGVSVLLLTEKASTEDFRRALQVGARDMLQIPIAREDLYTAMDAAFEVSLGKRTALEGLGAAEKEPERARGIAVFSTKGGTGKTFIATNVAAGLAQTGKRVALVDLDLQFGDAAIALGLVPERTMYDLVQTYTELDEQLMSEFMLAHPSGLQLLPAPLFPDQAEEITPDDVRRVLETVGPAYDYVVIDSPPLFEERVLAALDWADTILHIGSMDLPSIKNMKVTFSTMEAIDQPKDNVRLVMNRADSRVGLDIADAEKHLGMKIDHAIPSSIEVPRALNAGEVILLTKPGSRVARELAGIVATFEQTPTLAGRRRFGLLKR